MTLRKTNNRTRLTYVRDAVASDHEYQVAVDVPALLDRRQKGGSRRYFSIKQHDRAWHFTRDKLDAAIEVYGRRRCTRRRRRV